MALGAVWQPRVWFTGYEQTYLERDIRDLSRMVDLVSFRTFLGLTALRTAQVLTISELARDARLSAATAGRYLGLLEASFVVNRVPPFLGNRAARLIKSPKLFVCDAGLAAHLAGAGAERPDASDPLRGALLETYVAQNLAAILAAEWPGARLAYWHVQGRHEVDFVVESGRDCIAVEVKARFALERTGPGRAARLPGAYAALPRRTACLHRGYCRFSRRPLMGDPDPGPAEPSGAEARSRRKGVEMICIEERLPTADEYNALRADAGVGDLRPRCGEPLAARFALWRLRRG